MKYTLILLIMIANFAMLSEPATASGAKIPPLLKGVKRVGFFGDSLTDGSDYPEYVINTLNRTYPSLELTFFNAAVCGDETHDLVHRLDKDVLSQKPDLLFIMIGTNDSGGNPLIQFKAELLYLIRRLHENNVKVALISMTGSTDPKKVAKFKPYDNVIRDVAKTENVTFVDAWKLFEDWQKSGKEMYYEPGNAHHSLTGFQGVARAILNTLGVPENTPIDTTVAPPANVLTKWEESEPVSSKTKTPDSVKSWTPYHPEKWLKQRHWSFAPLVKRGAWFALQGDRSNKAFRGKKAFARTVYDAAEDGLYELQIGGGTPLQVWVNGTKVFTLKKTNGYHPNANRSPVFLKKGKNEIIITTGFYAFVGIEPLK